MTPETPSSNRPTEPDDAPAPGGNPRIPVLLLSAALILATILAFVGLSNHPLWTDEANTALFARNYLEFGKLTAWDGRNVFAFNWGSELDANLEQAFLPTQPYFIAAAAFAALDESTFAARAPFALIGVLAIGLTAWWTRRFLGNDFPWYLPAFLLALQPAFLLFIRNARYYSPGVFWTVALLIAWSVTRGRPAGNAVEDHNPGATRPLPSRQLARACLVLLCIAGLFTSQTIYAVAALAIFPVFFLDPAFRTRDRVLLFAVAAAAGVAGVFLVLQQNPGDVFADRRVDVFTWLKQCGILFWRHLRDMGPFEFFAWPLVLPLGLPWLLPRLESLRPHAKKALLLLAAFFVYLAAVAAVSPQNPATSTFADMRYVLPVTVLGAVITSVSLLILWRTARPLGAAFAVLLVFTNVLYVGTRAGQPRFLGGRSTIRSTLYDYLHEATHPYRSANTALIDYLANLPKDTKILTSPLHLSFPAMVYVPDLLYCEQLYANAAIRDDLKRRLPDYLFRLKAHPDAVLVMPELGMAGPLTETIELSSYNANVPPRTFRFGGLIETHVPDMTRPEIPLRLFHAPPDPYGNTGIGVYFPVTAPGKAPE